MRTAIILAAGLAALASTAVAQATPGLAGSWAQRSSGKELVLAPKFKLQPSAAMGYGTNLGGSVGYGSMTNTTIVTELQPMIVSRAMRLEVAPDGGFTWTIEKTQPDGKTCARTIRTEKRGRVTVSGGKAVFAVAGGAERWSNTCGKSGEGALTATTETYDLTRTGAALTLKGTGGVNWTFSRG